MTASPVAPSPCAHAASRDAGAAHQEQEVVDIERSAHVLAGVAQRRLEALDRLAPPFDVGIVRREHHQVGAALLDDPADVLGRVRREAHLSVDVLARAQRQRLQPFLVAVEGLEGRLHLTQPRRHPDRTLLDDPDVQIREPLEHAVEDERGQGLGRRSRDAHVVDRAEVLVTPVEVVAESGRPLTK